jgi:hypothetical protein
MTSGTYVTIGGLLSRELLDRVMGGDRSVPGMGATDYGLAPGERLNDAITRSWNRLQGLWIGFRKAEAALPDADQTATTVTRDRWLRPLLDELGFAGLGVARGLTIGGKDYPISHQWGGSVPVHLPGARVAVDRVSRGVRGAAHTSPHGLVQEFLNRSGDHLWGIVSNGLILRILRDNASLTRQAYVEFDLEAMFDGDAYSDFVVLWLCAHRTRFEGDPPEKCVLEQWTTEAATMGTRALDKLRAGVEAAITSLGEGLIAHPANGELRQALRSGNVAADDFQRQLLRVVYRLLFLLVAESRGLLLDPHAPESARLRYRQFYSLERLRTLAKRRRGTTHDDLWASLQVTMNALGTEGAPSLAISPLGSFLWAPDAIGMLAAASLDNRHLLGAVRHLTQVRDAEAKVTRDVDYRNLGAEELGSVYEALLELHLDLDVDARTFRLATAAGNERKTTGSYYTPTPLIRVLLDSALDPVIAEAEASPDPAGALLALNVLDPAAGSGHFLIAAAHRIAGRLASVRAEGGEPTSGEQRDALRAVIGHCLYGIDVNPMAVELCKVSLWMEAAEPGKPLSFLDHHIVCGNSLLGTTPALLEAGVPDNAFKPLEGDDRAWCTTLKATNKRERAHRSTGMFHYGSTLANDMAQIAGDVVALDALGDESTAAVDEKEARYQQIQASEVAVRAKLAADAWCAAFAALKTADAPVITDATVRTCAADPAAVPAEVRTAIDSLAARYSFLHLHLTFPDIFTTNIGESDGGSAQLADAGFDSVIGNPPFLSPLAMSGSKVTREQYLMKFVRMSLGGPKADQSSYFLLLASNVVKRQGRFGLVLPDSFLSATDSAAIRSHIATRHDLNMIWRGDGSEFEAAVTTAILSLGPSCDTPQDPVRLVGPHFEPILGPAPTWRTGSWAPLVARDSATLSVMAGISGPKLGDLCTVTADYRDQYYGLRGAVADATEHGGSADEPRLITTGLIDPLVCLWGVNSTKFDKTTFERPCVHVSLLSSILQRWAKSRLVPKVLVATQGKMVEAVIDEYGAWLPCVPVISVIPLPAGRIGLNEVAAILISPAAFDYFRSTKLGSGLSTGAIKVSAGDLRAMPAPPYLDVLAQAGLLLPGLADPDTRSQFRRLMNEAYGLPPDTGAAWEEVLSVYLRRSPLERTVLGCTGR